MRAFERMFPGCTLVRDSKPPNVLYFATDRRTLGAVRATGLPVGDEQYVLLYPDERTAIAMCQSDGPTVMLVIESRRMDGWGFKFYSQNDETKGWFTETVPPTYLRFEDDEQ
jgi:RNA:NAD 2'-phosphotransferase (TPT1/KptA family)